MQSQPRPDRAEIQLVYEGGGRFRTATKLDLELVNERYGQGEIIDVVPAKLRSRKQLRWFFAMIRQAFDVQSTGPEFQDEEHMRKWLLVRVNHCEVQQFEPSSVSRDVVAFLKLQSPYIFWSHDNRWIYARTPLSISMRGPAAIDAGRMCEIADAIIEVIMAEIAPGSSREDWEPYRQAGETWAAKRMRVKERVHAHG